MYKQKYSTRDRSVPIIKKDFDILVETLKYLESIGFIHGDLNQKNIMTTKDGFKIIDFEPSLEQMRNGKRELLVTRPYVSKPELYKKQISILTDKIGFCYFILRVNKVCSSKDIVSIKNTLDHKTVLGIDEKEIGRMSYSEILVFAYEHINNI